MMRNIAVDLFRVGSDERRSRRDQRRRLNGLLFLAAVLALSIGSNTNNELPLAGLSVVPAKIDFGEQTIGTTVTRSVTFTNSGPNEFVAQSISIEGSSSSDFGILAEQCEHVAPAAACVAEVSFAPRTPGPHVVTLTLAGQPAGSEHLELSGIGIALFSNLHIIPSASTFGDQLVGTPSAPISFTIENSGTAAMQVADMAVNNDQFRIERTCRDSLLSPRAQCMAEIVFLPAARQSVSAELVVIDGAGAKYSASLTGRGIVHQLVADADVLQFTVTDSDQKEIRKILLTNDGDDAVEIADVKVIGAGFTLESTSCLNTKLQSGDSCAVEVASFATAAAREGKAVIFGPNSGDEAVIRLQGPAAAEKPRPILTPSSRSLGVRPGQHVAGRVTITNTGTAPLQIKGITAQPLPRFQVGRTDCSTDKPLQPTKQCFFEVIFNAQVSGKEGRIEITSNAASSPDSVELRPTEVAVPFQ